MSLYDDALAAGAESYGGNLLGFSLDPSKNLTPEQLAQYLGGDLPDGYSVGNVYKPQTVGSGMDAQTTDDLSSGRRLIYGKQSGSGFHTQSQDVWDDQGNYLGTSGGDSNSLSIAKFIAGSVGGYYGAGYVNGLEGMGAAVGGSAATGMDVAALDVGLTGVTEGAIATGTLETAGMTAAEVAAQQAAQDAAVQQIVVTGSKIAPATIGAGELAVGAGATGALAELGTIPQADPTITQADQAFQDINQSELQGEPDYSNEGRNYPTEQSTQGPGGSPVNATQFPPGQINDVNGVPIPNGSNTVVPPGTTTPGTPGTPGTNLDPSKISDWTSLFNVLSGLYGLKLAGDAAEKSDPFGPYRKGYADQLLDLEKNPGQIQNRPGFRTGIDSVNRSMASRGYLGSGNQAGALMRFSGDFYNNEANRLATLAGANINPGNTYFNQAQLTGQALSNIGYGLTPYMQGGPK